MKLEITSRSETDTSNIGAQIGGQLRGGEIILLESDLGGGKTALTRGITLGIGSEDAVSSPTFMISQIYSGRSLQLHHYDLYRLGEMGLMKEELQEVMEDENNVVVIEWPNLVEHSLPENRVIHIKFELRKRDINERLITINYPDKLSYAIDKDVLEDRAW